MFDLENFFVIFSLFLKKFSWSYYDQDKEVKLILAKEGFSLSSGGGGENPSNYGDTITILTPSGLQILREKGVQQGLPYQRFKISTPNGDAIDFSGLDDGSKAKIGCELQPIIDLISLRDNEEKLMQERAEEKRLQLAAAAVAEKKRAEEVVIRFLEGRGVKKNSSTPFPFLLDDRAEMDERRKAAQKITSVWNPMKE